LLHASPSAAPAGGGPQLHSFSEYEYEGSLLLLLPPVKLLAHEEPQA
jgi:hypothetical protein